MCISKQNSMVRHLATQNVDAFIIQMHYVYMHNVSRVIIINGDAEIKFASFNSRITSDHTKQENKPVRKEIECRK